MRLDIARLPEPILCQAAPIQAQSLQVLDVASQVS